MIEAGITHRILSEFQNVKTGIETSRFVPVDIYVILFPFGILIVGIILAGIILLVEIIIYSHSKRKISKGFYKCPTLQRLIHKRPFRLGRCLK